MQGGKDNEDSGEMGHRVRGGEVICGKGATPGIAASLPLISLLCTAVRPARQVYWS